MMFLRICNTSFLDFGESIFFVFCVFNFLFLKKVSEAGKMFQRQFE